MSGRRESELELQRRRQARALRVGDIPRALVKQWRAEYRRRQKVIRKLEADAAKQEPPAAQGVATGD